MAAVGSHFRSGQIAIEMRIARVRDVSCGVFALAPTRIVEGKATVDDDPVWRIKMTCERRGVDEGRERHVCTIAA